jgi:hypothetical protein
MELKLLTNAVNLADIKLQQIINKTPALDLILHIVKTFIQENELILYGGTAINDILPIDSQFYNNSTIPDYDMYSVNAVKTAKDLADLYKKKGFADVEAKAGVHFGTYKVFVNFIPIADITYLHRDIFSKLKLNSFKIGGLSYANPEYLRMAMYLELSRPQGDITRWDKVFKRLVLLNTHYPQIRSDTSLTSFTTTKSIMYVSNTYNIIQQFIVDNKCVIIGCYAINLIKQSYKGTGKLLKYIPYFEILSQKSRKHADTLLQNLKKLKINCKLIRHSKVGDIIPEHFEIQINNLPIIFIYQTMACHSYNTILKKNKIICVASIETMIQLYLSFMYSPKNHHNTEHILNITEFLFYTLQKFRTENKGLLKRFSTMCVGTQEQLTSMRAEKSKTFKAFKALKTSKNKSKNYEKWFLNYKP